MNKSWSLWPHTRRREPREHNDNLHRPRSRKEGLVTKVSHQYNTFRCVTKQHYLQSIDSEDCTDIAPRKNITSDGRSRGAQQPGSFSLSSGLVKVHRSFSPTETKFRRFPWIVRSQSISSANDSCFSEQSSDDRSSQVRWSDSTYFTTTETSVDSLSGQKKIAPSQGVFERFRIAQSETY